MDPEERLVQQAQLSHAANPASKTFVYRNLVHADNWMTTVREKLDGMTLNFAWSSCTGKDPHLRLPSSSQHLK